MNTLKFISLAFAILTLRPVLQAQEALQSNVHIGLIYPLSTNGMRAKEYSNRFSLHGIAGVSRAETGTAFAGLALIIKDSATGLEASGFANCIGGNARGVQLAGFLNVVKNRAEGWQAAGFLNLDGSSRGLSVAGFGNISRDSSGVQAAGFINKAGNVRFQAAGFINVAKKVKGVQVAGLINIADSCEYPIGLLNFIRNGEKSISVSTDETLTTLVSFRSGSRKLYGIMGVGYNGKSGKDLYAWEAGLGAHFRLAPAFRINTELATIGLSDFKNGNSFRHTLRILPALRLGRHVEIFAGPSFNYADTKKGIGDGLITHYLWSEKESGNRLEGLYFGVTGGISIIL
jgi:hypothetical protein